MMTKPFSFAALAVLAVSLAAAPARADDVSEIHGQLVPVGQHLEYHQDFRRWIVSTNPIGWIVGSYGVSVSYAPHPHFAVRGDVNYFHPVDSDLEGYELGAGVPIYFRRSYLGLFLEPGIIVRHTEEAGAMDSGTTTYGPQILVGWHWSWDSGLNVSAAVGLGRNWAVQRSADGLDRGGDEIFANGYLRFGYAF